MINYAHRGASAYAPENTMSAFDLGLRMNADGIETDIRRTKDGVLVLFHDDDLLRIAGIPGSVEELTYEELSAIDLGLRKGPQYRGERIVTLDDFLSRFSVPGVMLALEIKGKGIARDVWNRVRNIRSGYTITSFDYDSLLEVRKLSDSPRLGYLTDDFSRSMIDRIVSDGLTEICPRADLITSGMSDYAHDKGLSVRAWGVADYGLMVHCCLNGADGMTVNFPDLLDDYLRMRGERP